jgi:type VII secretion integral membrane protein EccD
MPEASPAAEEIVGRSRIAVVSENPLEPSAVAEAVPPEGTGPDGTGPDGTGGDEERPPAGLDDLCRLNVCGPSRRVELAVPAHVPLIDLLPTMIGYVGRNLADAGLEHGGWVLQKLGEPPLSEELSITALGLHDGDTVHLRPRAGQLPPLDFDDLIDGIAVGIAGRPDRWRPQTSRRVLTGLLAVPLAAALGLLAGHPGLLACLLAVTAVFAFLALSAVVARLVEDPSAASIFGAAAIAYAAIAGAGLAVPSSARPLRAVPFLPWPVLLAAAVGVAVTSAVAGAAVGVRRPAFAAVTVAAALVAVASAAGARFGLGIVPVAGVTVALLLPLSGWIPALSFRLAGMHLDPLPTTPAELQADLDPLPGQQVLEQTRLTDRYQNALHAGLAVVAAACMIPLATARGLPPRLVVLDAALAMVLHARALAGARQRLAVLLPAVGGLGVLAVAYGLGLPASAWPVLFAGLLLTCGVLFAAARLLPGRRSLPHWGWAGDIFQSLSAMALIPLVLWLLGLFHYARVHG